MSAYIVDREVIDRIVTQAVDSGLIDARLADAVGRELWLENVASVAYRYPNDENGDRPGPIGFRDEDAGEYVWKRDDRPRGEGEWEPVDNYRYQSCERDDWRDSFAEALTCKLGAADA